MMTPHQFQYKYPPLADDPRIDFQLDQLGNIKHVLLSTGPEDEPVALPMQEFIAKGGQVITLREDPYLAFKIPTRMSKENPWVQQDVVPEKPAREPITMPFDLKQLGKGAGTVAVIVLAWSWIFSQIKDRPRLQPGGAELANIQFAMDALDLWRLARQPQSPIQQTRLKAHLDMFREQLAYLDRKHPNVTQQLRVQLDDRTLPVKDVIALAEESLAKPSELEDPENVEDQTEAEVLQ